MPNSHIPTSERDMGKVKPGDLVLLTIESGDAQWALFEGINYSPGNIRDYFLVQSGAGSLGDRSVISQYVQERLSHKYDNQRGIVLIGDFQHWDYQSTGAAYSDKAKLLKQAGLWQESESLAEVKA